MQILLIITCDLDLLIEKTMIISTNITKNSPPLFFSKGSTLQERGEAETKLKAQGCTGSLHTTLGSIES